MVMCATNESTTGHMAREYLVIDASSSSLSVCCLLLNGSLLVNEINSSNHGGYTHGDGRSQKTRGNLLRGKVLVLDAVFGHTHQSRTGCVSSQLEAHGTGYHLLHRFVRSTCIAMVVSAEDLLYASRMKLLQNGNACLDLDVEVLVFLVEIFQKPGYVLKDDGVFGSVLLQHSVQPLLVLPFQVFHVSPMSIELGIEHNAMHTAAVEIEVVIAEIVDVPLNTLRCWLIAYVVIAADADERNGRVQLTEDLLDVVLLPRSKRFLD